MRHFRYWCTSAVVTVMWKTSHILDSCAQLPHHKWRASQSAQLYDSSAYNQRTVSGTKYQLQCVGNHDGNVVILQVVPGVPQMLTQDQKEHCMQIWQVLLNQYKAESDSFIGCIVTCDNMWCHHYKLESKWQFTERWDEGNFPLKKKVQGASLSE